MIRRRGAGRTLTCPNIPAWAVGFLHALEQGQKEPRLDSIDILAKNFEMSLSQLMRGV